MVKPIPLGGSGQCTAMSKRSGERCKHAAMIGKTVCHMHGGKSLIGPASPRARHLRYSKLLPARLKDTYMKAVNDPELLSVQQDIALLDSRLAEVLRQIDTGESGRLWVALQTTWTDMEKARAKGDKDKLPLFMVQLGDLIERGLGEHVLWAEIADLLERRRRLVESERKRLVEAQAMITAEQAMVLIANLVDIVRRHVTDRPTLAAISTELAGLVAAEARRGLKPGRDGEPVMDSTNGSAD